MILPDRYKATLFALYFCCWIWLSISNAETRFRPVEIIQIAQLDASREDEAPDNQDNAAAAEEEFQRRISSILNQENLELDTLVFMEQISQHLLNKGDDQDLLEAHGILYFARQEFFQAITSLEKLKNPGVLSKKMIALSYYEVGTPAKGIKYFKGIPKGTLTAPDWLKFCDAYLKAGKRKAALKEYESLVKKFPETEKALVFLVEYYRKPLEKSKLAPHLEALAELHPEDAPLLLELSELYEPAHPKAIKFRKQYLELKPGDVEASLAQARAFEKSDNKGMAVDIYLELAPQFSRDHQYNLHLADLLMEKNLMEKAITHYEIAHKILPSDVKTTKKLAGIYARNQNLIKAVELYKLALEANPGDKSIQKSYMDLADRTGDRRVMMNAYQFVQTKSPESHEAFYKQAKIHHEIRKEGIAYKNLYKAIQLNPGNITYEKLLPEVILDDDQIRENFTLLKKLADKPGATPKTKLLCARGFVLRNQYQKAAPLYKAVHMADPTLLHDNLEAIQSLTEGGEHSLAGDMAQVFLDRNPGHKKAASLHVINYEKSGKGKKSLTEAVENLLSLDSTNNLYWLKLARLQLSQGNKEAALENALKWVKHHPGSVEGYEFILPLVSKNKKHKGTYTRVLEKLIALDPGKSSSRRMKLGLIKYDNKKFNEAEKLLESASKDFSENAEVWHKLGKIRHHKNLKGKGSSQFKKAWQLSPGNIDYMRDYSATLKTDDEIKANLKLFKKLGTNSPTLKERIRLAKSYYLNGNYQQAANLFSKLLEQDARLSAKPMLMWAFIKTGKLNLVIPSAGFFAKDFELNSALARALEKQGRIKDALRFYQVGWSLKPKNEKLLLKMARLNKQIKNTGGAIDNYQALLKLKPEDKKIQLEYLALAKKNLDVGGIKVACEFILKADPNSHKVLYSLARANLDDKDKKSAYKNLTRAIKHSPDKEYLELLPRTIETDNQIKENLKTLKTLAARPGPDPQVILLTARGHSLKNEMKEAAELYQQVYRRDKKLLQGNTNAIKVLYDKKKYTMVADLSEKYLFYKPRDKEIRVMQLKSYEKTGADKTRIHKAINDLVKLEPDTKDWWLMLARLELAKGNKKLALGHGKTWMARNPGSLEGYKFLLPLVKGNNIESATYITVLENLVKRDKDVSDKMKIELGLLYFKNNKYSKSENLLAQAVKTSPGRADIWYTLGRIRAQKGKKAGGHKEFARAHELAPDNTEYAREYGESIKTDAAIKANLKLFKLLNKKSPTFSEQVKLAKSYLLNKDFKSASEKFVDVLKMSPDIIESDPIIIKTLMDAKKYHALIPVFEKRLVKSPDNIKLLDTLCILYQKTGKKEKYLTTAAKIARINPKFGEYQLVRARQHVKEKDIKKALKDYDQFTARNPSHEKALKELYGLAKAQKDTSRMGRTLHRMVKIKGVDKKYSYIYAELKLKKQKDPRLLEKRVEQDNEYHKGKKLLIKHYYARDQIASLLKFEIYLESASRKDKSLLAPYAEVLAHHKKTEKAVDIFYQAVLADKKNKKLFTRVLSYSKSHNSPHMIKLYSLGRKSFPGDMYIKSEYAKSLGKTPKALGEYLGILKEHKNRLEAIKAVVEISKHLNKPEPSIKWLKRWHKIEPKNTRPLKRLVEIYEVKKDEGELLDALVDLQKIQPEDHKLAFRIGKLYTKKDKTRKAVEYYQIAASIRPRHVEYQRHLGLALAKRKKYKKAKKPLLAAYQNKKFDEQVEYALFLTYEDLKQAKASDKQLRRLVRNRPDEPRYAFVLAERDDKKKHHKNVIKILEHPPLMKKLDGETTTLLILQYVKTKQLKKATDFGRATAKKMPKALPVELGAFLYQHDKLSDSKRILDNVIKYNDSPEAYYYRARIAHKQNNWDLAIKYYKKGRKFSVEYNRNLALCYIKKKDYKNAARAYENYYDDVENTEILLTLHGLYQKKVDDPKKRRKVLERLIKAFPKKYAYVPELADVYVETGKTKKAVKMFRQVLKKHPGNARANLHVGMYLAKKNEYKEAIRRLGVGLKKYPGNYKAWELLGDCYEEINQLKSAQFAFKKAELAKTRKKK